MKKMLAVLGGIIGFCLLAVTLTGQNPAGPAFHRLGDAAVAANYNWQGKIIVGNTTTGSGSTLIFLVAPLPDGTVLSPTGVFGGGGYSNFTPVLINDASPETDTPTAESPVSCGAYGYVGQCVSITATINSLHGLGGIVQSGTMGLQEAINDMGAAGGGAVEIGPGWTQAGGTSAMLSAAIPYPTVYIVDNRGFAGSAPYWIVRPTTLTALATPSTRAATGTYTAVVASGTGTYTNAAQYVCVTYVDELGGESPCSGSFSVTPSGTQGLLWNSPAASAGAVGWKPYTGVTGVTTQYEVPLTSSICTLTTLENVIPACAIGSQAFTTTPNTNTRIAPQAFTVNLYLPLVQSHTTFGYTPSSYPPQGPFQTDFGPFTATGSVTASDVAVLGTIHLPAGYFGAIGKTVRIRGKITFSDTATGTIGLTVGEGTASIYSSGAPKAACTFAPGFAWTTAAQNATFDCTLTVNALSPTAGTMMSDGIFIGALAAGGVSTFQPVTVDTGTAAIGSLDTTNQADIWVVLSAATEPVNPAQLLDLHVN